MATRMCLGCSKTVLPYESVVSRLPSVLQFLCHVLTGQYTTKPEVPVMVHATVSDIKDSGHLAALQSHH